MAADPTEPLSVDKLTDEFTRLKKQKYQRSGGVEGRTLWNIAMVIGEQWAVHRNGTIELQIPDSDGPQLVWNLIEERVSKLDGILSSVFPEFRALPDKRDPRDLQAAKIRTKLIRALDEKSDEENLDWCRRFWQLTGGVSIDHLPWVPNRTIESRPILGTGGELVMLHKPTGQQMLESQMDQMTEAGIPEEGIPPMDPADFQVARRIVKEGDFDDEVHGPLTFYIDSSVPSIDRLGPGQWCFFGSVRTLDWIKTHIGSLEGAKDVDKLEPEKQIRLVETAMHHLGDAISGHSLEELMPVVQGAVGQDDPPMAPVITGYSPVSEELAPGWSGQGDPEFNNGGRWVMFVPGQRVLVDREIPYRKGIIPAVDIHWKASTTTFWTQTYIEKLISPQIFVNVRMNQAIDYCNSYVKNKKLAHPEFNDEMYGNADETGIVMNGLTEEGNPMIRPEEVPQMPAWFWKLLEEGRNMFDELAGADLFQQSGFPGQFRGNMTFEMMQELMNSPRWPYLKHAVRQKAKIHEIRLNHTIQFYTEDRLFNFFSRTDRHEIVEFKRSEIHRPGTNFSVTYVPGTIFPEFRAAREDRINRRMQSGTGEILYQDPTTGEIDPQKLAEDMLYGDEEREAMITRKLDLARQQVERIMQGKEARLYPSDDPSIYLQAIDEVMDTMTFRYDVDPEVQEALAAYRAEFERVLQERIAAQEQSLQDEEMQGVLREALQQHSAQLTADLSQSFRNTVQELFEQFGPGGAAEILGQYAGQGAPREQ